MSLMKKALFALALLALAMAPALAVEELGNKDARVTVKAFVPTRVECHQKTIQILREIVKREPERVFVQIYELRTPECTEEMEKFNITCASVFVNGKNRYEITRDGKVTHIEMAHRPNDPNSTYSSEDVRAVIAQAIMKEYGMPPAFGPAGAPMARPAPRRPDAAPFTLKDEYGPRNARVKMLVLLPSVPQQRSQGPLGGGMNPVVGFRNMLAGVARSYKGKVYLRFVDFESDQGRAELKRRGLARRIYILVNGQYKFRVQPDDPDLAYRDVQLIGFPGNIESSYMHSDLPKVLDMAVRKAYGK